MSRTRNWRFTLNIDDEHLLWESDFEALCAIADHSSVRGLIFQEEIGGNTERQHYQGFIRFKNAKTRQQCIDLFTAYTGHTRTHFDKSDYPVEAIEYCRKGETRLSADGMWEFGDLEYPQGKRSDLLECKEIISKAGWRHAELYESHFSTSVRYMQGLEKASFYMSKAKQVERDVEVHWLWGKAGTGKSRDARAGLTINDYFRLPTPQGGRVWFDGYEGEEILIIEEFNTHTMTIENFLELCDRYPLQQQVKGAFIWANWKKVVITSQFHFSSIYPFASEEQLAALRRRVTYEKHYDSEPVLQRDPEDRRFFTLRDRVVSAPSDTLSYNRRMGLPPYSIRVDAREDSPSPVRGPQNSARRRIEDTSDEELEERTPDMVPSSQPPITPTQLVAQETLSGGEEEEEILGSQQYEFSFPGIRSQQL